MADTKTKKTSTIFGQINTGDKKSGASKTDEVSKIADARAKLFADDECILTYTKGALGTSRNPPKRLIGVDRYRTFEEGAEKGRPTPCKFEDYNDNDNDMESVIQ